MLEQFEARKNTLTVKITTLPEARPLRTSLYVISFCVILVAPIFYTWYSLVFAAGSHLAAARKIYSRRPT